MASNITHPTQHEVPGEDIRVSQFDAIVGVLVTMMLFMGFLTAMLFALWLWSQLSFPRPEIKVVSIEENPAGRGENAEGFERDFEPPGAEEVEDLTEPTVQDTLTAVTDAVTSVAASLDAVDSNASANTQGTGSGDSRPPGPEGEGDDIIPRFLRWQLKFTAKNLQEYAAQLDSFKIELGVVGGGVDGVDYVNSFVGGGKKRHGESDAEKRLYFRWTDNNNFAKFDAQLLQKGGVNPSGRISMMFLEKDLENVLATIELEYASKAGINSVKQIAKTIFEVESAGKGYSFKVVDQRYRVPKK